MMKKPCSSSLQLLTDNAAVWGAFLSDPLGLVEIIVSGFIAFYQTYETDC